jgi:hypothetical protein
VVRGLHSTSQLQQVCDLLHITTAPAERVDIIAVDELAFLDLGCCYFLLTTIIWLFWLVCCGLQVNNCYYGSSAEFVADCQALVAACEAYNTPGHGKLATPALINLVKQVRAGALEEHHTTEFL